MHKHDESGSLVIPLIITGSLLFLSLIFGFWAFAGRQEYKNNTDAKIADAVEVAEEQVSIKKAEEFAEKEKLPSKTFTGSSAYGSISIVYPKTWSVYLGGSGSQPINGYMSPDIVRGSNTVYSLRFQVTDETFSSVAKGFEAKVKDKSVTYAAYRPPKQEGVTGARITGQLSEEIKGDLVILPLRDKTIKLWTEGDDFRGDFEAILKEFNFVP